MSYIEMNSKVFQELANVQLIKFEQMEVETYKIHLEKCKDVPYKFCWITFKRRGEHYSKEYFKSVNYYSMSKRLGKLIKVSELAEVIHLGEDDALILKY